MLLAMTRSTPNMSYECLGGHTGEMPGELNAPRRARTCRRINALKADIRDGVTAVYRGARAVRLAAETRPDYSSTTAASGYGRNGDTGADS